MPDTLVRRHPLANRILPQRVFYGWWVTLASATLMFVSVGVGYYGLAVFLRPLQEAHGWSNAVVSGATGLYFSLAGLTGAIIGPRIDRRGPLRLMLVGCVLLGLAVAMVGYVNTIWQLYSVYTLLAVGFGMSTSVGVNAIMARWFVARRARAMSIAFTGVSVGGVLLVPIGSALIARGGLELAAPVMGALVIVVSVPMILGVLVWDPAQMGLVPDGATVPSAAASALERVQLRVWTRRSASRTLSFWAVLVAFVLVLSAQSGFLIHQLSFLEDRFGSRSAAALALSTTAGGSIVARLIVGIFADRLDKRVLTISLFALQGSAVLAALAVDNTVVTYALVLVIGFTIGNIYMMQTLLVGDIFGMVSFGTVFGLVSLASQVGSGTGPFLVGWLEDRTGGYTTPFVITALMTYVAAAAVLLARPVRPPPDPAFLGSCTPLLRTTRTELGVTDGHNQGMPDDAPRDVHEEAHGEQAEVGPAVWAEHLESHVRMAREMGVESHTKIVDTDEQAHDVELAGDIERIEAGEGRHVLIWLRNAGIITVSGAAIVTAVAVIRHRLKAKS